MNFKNKNNKGKLGYRKNTTPKPKINKSSQKYNTPSFVLRKIEDAIQIALTANKTSLIAGKIYEASKYIDELKNLEEMGIYRGKNKSKDYVSSLLNRKDKILIDGIKRAYNNGETKEEIMESSKYFSDEVKAFIDTLE